MPLTTPKAAPISTAAPSAIHSGQSVTTIMPMTTPHSPSTGPRLRSMPSVRITSVMPSATITSTAICSVTLVRLAIEKKFGVRMVRPIDSTASR